jgi:hypothetical protein
VRALMRCLTARSLMPRFVATCATLRYLVVIRNTTVIKGKGLQWIR